MNLLEVLKSIDVNDVAMSLTKTGMLVGGAVYVAKKIVDSMSTKGIEKYKDKLKRESDYRLDILKAEHNINLASHKASLNTEIETHKDKLKQSSDEYQTRISHELQLIKDERSVVFSKLHERRLQGIEKLYKRLYWLHKDFQILLGYIKNFESELTKSEQMQDVRRRYGYAVKHLQYNKIYFDEEFSTRIECYLCSVGYMASVYEDITLHGHIRGLAIANIKKQFEETTVSLYANIENEFRKLLGVK
jgi:hypothetical protein